MTDQEFTELCESGYPEYVRCKDIIVLLKAAGVLYELYTNEYKHLYKDAERYAESIGEQLPRMK